jgi:hypothetical protein
MFILSFCKTEEFCSLPLLWMSSLLITKDSTSVIPPVLPLSAGTSFNLSKRKMATLKKPLSFYPSKYQGVLETQISHATFSPYFSK